jgi:hypothetical protein
MKKYTIQRNRKKIPLFVFFIILIPILVVELFYFNIFYAKRSQYLNLPDYKPITLQVHDDLKFIQGDFPISAQSSNVSLYIFKNLSLNLSNIGNMKIYSNKPYHMIFSDGYSKYEFFGKILYLRSLLWGK